MKAAQINKYGGSDVIEIKEVQKPQLKAGQILVEVYAASLNPFDRMLREGHVQKYLPLQFPITLGGDFSGIVTEVYSGVTEFKAGDEVYGQAVVVNGGSGSFAQFVGANVKNTALKPKTIDQVGAASLPLVGTSALQALEEHINIQTGQKILIQGGSGGIGSLAIQIAKLHGAYVATTVSEKSKEFVKKLGADEVIDYQAQDFSQVLADFDAVFDTTKGEEINKSIKVLKKAGKLVSMIGQAAGELIKASGITAITQRTIADTVKLNRLAELVDSGKIKPQVDKTFTLVEIKEAFDYLEKDHPIGKVVLKIK